MSPLLGLHLKHLAFLSLFCLSAALCSSPLISFPLYPPICIASSRAVVAAAAAAGRTAARGQRRSKPPAAPEGESGMRRQEPRAGGGAAGDLALRPSVRCDAMRAKESTRSRWKEEEGEGVKGRASE
uniref:Uncharacterized protein n=1 Tax=Zea mays TaxID=4577 RepID=C4J2T9_MAIZE|nr:unknown [Zea mays]